MSRQNLNSATKLQNAGSGPLRQPIEFAAVLLRKKFCSHQPNAIFRLVLLLLCICSSTGVLFAQEDVLTYRAKQANDKTGQQKIVSKDAAALAICTGLTLTQANATTNSLTNIIQSLVGPGIAISNVTTNLPATSDIYGSFSCGSSSVGLEQGIIITTGALANAKGPNSSQSASRANGLPGNALLNAIGGSGNDASVISFNITPTGNTLTFNYAFASEEYNDFVGSSFNDVFAFFISGPGITGNKNIALLPGTTTPVTINNVNKGRLGSVVASNPSFFINNDDRTLPAVVQTPDLVRYANLEYDGLTIPLTATVTVIPGQTYTLTFAIQDVGDAAYDSGVFIEGGSIQSSDLYYSKPSGDLHNVLTWGLNPDGSGTNPPDFSTGKTFQLANRAGVYTMTADWAVGGVINIPSGNQLQINGYTLSLTDLAGAGTLSGSSTSNLTVIGTAGGNIPLNFTAGSNSLNNFTVNRLGTSATATLGNALNVVNVLMLTSGILNTSGFLTLKSSATNTARVAPVSGSISGDVTVERYIPARRAWRILSAPVGGIATGAAIGQASLTHSQEPGATPLTTSTGGVRPLSYGTATFSLNAAQTAMTMVATVYNIDITGSQTPDVNDNLGNAHIHVGAALGSNAAVRWGFFGSPDNDIMPKQLVITPFASGVGGTFTSTWDLNEGNSGTTLTSNLPGILAGLSYINFHTTQFAGGEIRGQITLVGAGTQTINQAWQEGAILGASANPNPFPGYGTHITGGPIYGSIANGFDQNPLPGAESSVKRYNPLSNNWEELPNTNATYVGSDAFITFIRGDRSIPLGYNTVSPTTTTLRAKGPLKVGDQVFQVSGNGFTGIPNPFASPINFPTITRSGVQNNFYVWDPKMGGDYGVGAYILLSDNGIGGYNITPAPVSPESQYIQSGQGFLVRPMVAATAGSITIKESDKSATAATDVFRTSGGAVNSTPKFVDPNSGQGWRITLKGVAANSSAPVLDEVLVSYHSIYNAALDDLDAVKMENVQENLGMIREGQVLMVERKPLPQESDVVALKLWNAKSQSYILEVNPVNMAGTGLSAWLEDKYLKTSTPVNLTEKLQVSFVVGTDVASARMDRFRLVIGKKLPDALTLNKSNIMAYPNPVSGRELTLAFSEKSQGAYLITVSNASGQVILRKSLQHSGGTASHIVQLPASLIKGVYRVRVSSTDGESSFSITKN